MEHELKTHPPYFQAILDGRKPFEVRRDDRESRFEPGDTLWLREWQPDPAPERSALGTYTGRETRRWVSYVLRGSPIGPWFGVQPGFAILGLSAYQGDPPTLALRTQDHPEANGRQPVLGEKEARFMIPLEGDNWLNLRMGAAGLVDLRRVLELEAMGSRLVRWLFVERMERELRENERKGPWTGWTPTIPEIMAELNHHLFKLETALHQGKVGEVTHYAADVANLAMKACECYGDGQHDAANIHEEQMRPWKFGREWPAPVGETKPLDVYG